MQALLRARGDEFSLAAAHVLAQGDAGASAREDLARLASTSGDARIHALAYRQRFSLEDGNCQLVTTTRWATLDSTNALPWLYAAMDAFRDGTARDVAMRKAADATRLDDGDWSVVDALPLPAGGGAALSRHAHLLVDTLGRQSVMFWVPRGVVISYCLGPRDAAGKRLPRPERAEVCQRLAEMLATRAGPLTARLAGIDLGASLGWPVERVERQRANAPN